MTARSPWQNRIVGSGEEAPDQLLANPKNWRTHPVNQREALRGALDQVGWVQQVMVNRVTGHIVDGHARVEEALSRGEPTVPVLYVELEPHEEDVVLATLDPIGALATRDDERLRMLLAEVEFDAEALREMTANLLPIDPKVGLTDPDDVPELADDSGIVAGDLFALGDHRLMCGDSTKPEDVARLLGGAKPRLLITDPPYGVELDMGWRDDLMKLPDKPGFTPRLQGAKAEPSYMRTEARRFGRKNGDGNHASVSISGDTVSDWSPAFALVPSLEVAYVWFADRHTIDVMAGLAAIGFEHRQTIIWLKPYGVMSRTHYNYQHEPCWYGVKTGCTAGWQGDTKQTTVWDAISPKMMMGSGAEQKFDHPTQKPIAVITRPILNHKGDVYEPFSGSGTTLVASETLGRRCYAMEIDPKYVAVAIKRWEEFTGRQAVKLG